MSRRLLACCALVATVGCGGASPVVPPGPSLNGIWTLRTVNNATLPYTLPYSPDGDPTTVLGATLTMSGAVSGVSITFNDTTFAEVHSGSLMNTSLVKMVLFGYSGEYSR
jgi:hypothetical protein